MNNQMHPRAPLRVRVTAPLRVLKHHFSPSSKSPEVRAEAASIFGAVQRQTCCSRDQGHTWIHT